MKKLLLTASLLYANTLLFAQWSADPAINTPVSIATGKQVDSRIIADGFGGAFIAWKDYRNGLPDVYIQYLDAAGIVQWTTDGAALCTESADQSTPAITTDMAGGAIVAWSDWRTGIERDVFAQRINAQGVVQWTLDGVGIANKTEREHNEKIISDDAGGAIIIWEQQSPFTGQWDIWGQRINAQGVAQWTVGGIPICTVDANRLNPKVQRDGAGGAIIAWQDYRNALDYDVYAQRVSATGTLMWGTGGLAISAATNAQTDPKIDPDTTSGGAYITWVDKRNGTDYDIYAQRVNGLGTALWAANGVPVCAATGNQTAQDVLSGTYVNGVIVTWKDNRNGSYDIFSQRLDTNGVAQWTTNGVAVSTPVNDQLNPNIIDDLAGGGIIAWQDSSGIDWDIKAQRIKSDGTLLWQAGGVNVATATNDQTSPKSVSDGIGGCIFTFEDKRSGTNDVYAHHLFSNGTTVAPVGVTEIATNPHIHCYPNPFSSQLTIELDIPQDEKVKINVQNSLGQDISYQLISKNEASNLRNYLIELPNPVSGVYFIKISGQHWIKTMPIIQR